MMKPGKPPTWESGAKSGVGTALDLQSRVWFTLVKGCVTETFYPRPDLAHTRCLFLTVSDQRGFFSDERFDTTQKIQMREPAVPIFEAVNHCREDRYRITKTVCADPFRDVVLQHIRFEAKSANDPLTLWLFLMPALNNEAYGNNASVDSSGQALIVRRNEFATALTASCGFARTGCSYQGPDDLWNRLKSNQTMGNLPDCAEDGNVVLAAELDYRSTNGEFVITLGFGTSADEARKKAIDSAAQSFDTLASEYVRQWREYRQARATLNGISTSEIYATSIAVLKTHQSKRPEGAVVASLGVPWGETNQQILDFRYQLCWTRDAVETATAFIAMDDTKSAVACWEFLKSTQQEDGHWPQNMWLDGKPHWSGLQMDETALPILLANVLHRHSLIDVGQAWVVVRAAAAYLIQNGPGTEQDRWERDGGYSPYTLAVEIAALLAAADFADSHHDNEIAAYLRVVADWWNDCIEDWTFIDGRYARLATPDKNRNGEIRGMTVTRQSHANSPAALALVRFGLRSANDSRIRSSVEAIDKQLRSETETGPVWHRYPNDQYGEHEDGRPFDGNGIGRGWPLLAGERAHYEIAAGNIEQARKLAAVIEQQTGPCGFIPEQVWDRADLPRCGLYSGRPSGSAMPLAWAHAEYIKLLRSLADRAVFDMPLQPVERYQLKHTVCDYCLWRAKHKITSIPRGKILRVECDRSAVVYWTLDDWQTVHRTTTRDSQLGIHYVDVPTADLLPDARVGFTFWREADRRWENRAYELSVIANHW